MERLALETTRFIDSEGENKKKYWDSRTGKVEKILKGSLDSILSPSPSVEIQTWSEKLA